MNGPCLLFLLRAPRSGQVKTRLAAALGDAAALALYTAMVADTLDVLDASGLPLALWVDPGRDRDAVRRWLGRDRLCLPQPEGDLGARMAAAFAWAFGQGYPSAAALGSDLPAIAPAHLTALRAALGPGAPRQAALGPSPDGGYWCIGFRANAYLPSVFSNMPWSTPQVFARTREALGKLDVGLLPALADLDTLEDALALRAGCPPGLARRTLELLDAELG